MNVEEQLLKIFIAHLLKHECFVSIGDIVWHRVPYGDKEAYENNTEDGALWSNAESVAEAILSALSLRRKSHNDLVFHTDESGPAVTWRMLKIEMPFLRIVTSKDPVLVSKAMTRIIEHLVEILDQAMKGEQDEQ